MFYLSLVIILSLALFILWAQSPLDPKRPRLSHSLKKFLDQETFPSKELTVVTYNLGYASGKKNNLGHVLSPAEVQSKLEKAAAALKKIKPDLVFLQEVDFKARRSHRIDQLAFLAKALQLPYAAQAITWNLKYLPWPSWRPSQHFGAILSGQAVLSRLPIQKQKLINLKQPPRQGFLYNRFYLEKIAQQVNIHWQGKVLSLYNVHLEAFDHQHRQDQLNNLRKIIQQDPHASLIVAGDFNQNDANLNLIQDSDFAASALSFPAWKPQEYLDQIHGRGLEKLAIGQIQDLDASDHLAIWVQVKLK